MTQMTTADVHALADAALAAYGPPPAELVADIEHLLSRATETAEGE